MKNTKKIINLSFLIMLLCLVCSNKNVQANEVGKLAADILLPNSSGQQVSLASQKGKLVLVYFWASWDPNSRINNPNLAIIQQKYNKVQFKTAKGFDIFSVSLDKDANEWINAAKKDGLLTPYCTNDKKSRYVKPYNVGTLPASFLINENGYIVGKNLSMTELDQMLAAQASYYFAEETTTTTVPATSTTTTTQTVQNASNTSALPYTTPPLIGGGRAETTTITSVATQQATQQQTVVQQQAATQQQTTNQKDISYYTTKYVGTDGDALVDNAYSTYKTPFEAKAKASRKSNTTSLPATAPIEPTPTPQPTQVRPKPVTATVASLKDGNAYRIQLGAYKVLDFDRFYSIADYGNITTEIDDNDLKRVLIGDYQSAEQMQAALQAIKQAGFADAFAVLYNGHNRVSEMSKKAAPATMSVPTTSYATQVKPSISQTTTSFVQPTTQATANNYVQTTTQQTITKAENPNVITVFPTQTATTTTYQSGTGGNNNYSNVSTQTYTQPQQYSQTQSQGTYYDNNFSWYPEGSSNTRSVYQSPSYTTNPAATSTTYTKPSTYSTSTSQSARTNARPITRTTQTQTTTTNRQAATNTRPATTTKRTTTTTTTRTTKPQTYSTNTTTTKSVSQAKKEDETCDCKQLKAENAAMKAKTEAATAELEKLRATENLNKNLDKYLEGYDYWSVSESDSKKLSKKQERERKRKERQEKKNRKKEK